MSITIVLVYKSTCMKLNIQNYTLHALNPQDTVFGDNFYVTTVIVLWRLYYIYLQIGLNCK